MPRCYLALVLGIVDFTTEMHIFMEGHVIKRISNAFSFHMMYFETSSVLYLRASDESFEILYIYSQGIKYCVTL